MIADKAERRMGTKDRVFWKPTGKYRHIMKNKKEKKEKGGGGDNHRKTKTLRKKRQ